MEGGPAPGPLQARELDFETRFRVDAAVGRLRLTDRVVEERAETPPQVQVRIEGIYPCTGKRIFDFLFSAAFLLLVGTWLFPVIGLAIRVNSRGPIFFRQRRVGLNGQTFTCLKFRTMTYDPDARFIQAQKNDCRITRVGAFLRRTNLDEIPQFINVLMGQMSVIGPRPHVPELDAVFKDVVPGYTVRNIVKPGVSGLAQVSGCRGETRSIREMNHRVRFDVFYCRNVSFAMDLKLMGLTVARALQGDEKAY